MTDLCILSTKFVRKNKVRSLNTFNNLTAFNIKMKSILVHFFHLGFGEMLVN